MGILDLVAANSASTKAAANKTGAAEFNLLLRTLLAAKGDVAQAEAMAAADKRTPQRVTDVLRSAVTVGGLGNVGWANATGDYRQLVSAYITSLAPFSAFDRMLSDGAFQNIPPRTPVSVTTTAATGYAVGEGQIKPLSSMAFDAPAISVLKAICAVIVTAELARNPQATGLIGRQLRQAVVKATDTSAMAIVVAGGTSSGTAGGSVANLVTDIGTAFTNLADIGVDSKLYWVAAPALVAALAARLAGTAGWSLTPLGGELAGVPVVLSTGATAGALTLVDASRFAANNDTITLEAITHGIAQMSTTPDSPDVAGTINVSLWQTNQVAQAATRYFGLVKLTDSASATVTGMS
jgi:hypothetical protein